MNILLQKEHLRKLSKNIKQASKNNQNVYLRVKNDKIAVVVK